MAVTSNTGTATPLTAVETDVVTLTGGPYDNVSAYNIGGLGGAGGNLRYTLYAVVGGIRTRIAFFDMQGDSVAQLIEWPRAEENIEDDINVNAGGQSFVVTVIDLSTSLVPPGGLARQPVTVTLAGVDQFDTQADANVVGAFALTPGATGTLTAIAGYAQLMDIACSQQNLPDATIELLASNTGGGALTNVVVKRVELSGSGGDIAAVFRQILLPVATSYTVQITNNGANTLAVVLTASTYSVSVTGGGGPVTLSGDVIGPSSSNTVIKWDNIPLTLAGTGTFGPPINAAFPIFDSATATWRALDMSGGATMNNSGVVTINASSITLVNDVIGPANNNQVVKWDHVPLLTGAVSGSFDLAQLPDAAIAIYDIGTHEWRAFAMSGGATMTNAGVVTVTGGATLVGNVNGPPGTNKWTSFIIPAADVDVVIPNVEGWYYVAVSGLSGPSTHSVTLPATPTAGEVVVVTDEDGSLAAFAFDVIGNTKLVQGMGTFPLNNTYPGSTGSVCFQYDGTAWHIFADYAPNAGAGALVGNVNGTFGANKWTSFIVPAANVDVAIPDPEGWYYVAVTGLTGTHQVTLPMTPTAGEVVVVTDEDGSLATQIFNVEGNGKLVNGSGFDSLTSGYPGPFGSVCYQYDGTAWFIFADYAPTGEDALDGNVIGPYTDNRFLALLNPGADANVNITEIAGWTWVGMSGLSADRTVLLPPHASATAGEVVVVTDETASLATHNIIVDGNGTNVQGAPTYTMRGGVNGIRASVAFVFDGTDWYIFSAFNPGITTQSFAGGGAHTVQTMSQDMLVMVDNTAGASTLNLPTPTGALAGMRITIKDQTGTFGVNPCTLHTPAGLIEGNGDFVANAAWMKLIVVCDGTNYYV